MRTIIALLLGAWLMGTLVVGGVAAENFFMIDHLLRSPSNAAFHQDVAQLAPGEARVMLRFVSSELNRLYFDVWGWIEFGLAAVVLLLAMAALRERKFTIGFSMMLALVAVMLFYLTPRLIEVGRTLDFVSRQPPPPGWTKFAELHGTYSLLDLAKLTIGVWMAVALARLERRPVRYELVPNEAARQG